ncbi:MAG: hypothetical protein FRX49_08719 [Trebouxia sp. A1-2]|nr:MAG: hypothetical protein FRX49_08719 [Trebouxia sp. A1-2]
MPLLPWQQLPAPAAGGVQMGLLMQLQPQLQLGLVQLSRGGWKGHGCGHAWLPAHAHGAAADACDPDQLPETSVGVGVEGLMLARPKHQAVLGQLTHRLQRAQSHLAEAGASSQAGRTSVKALAAWPARTGAGPWAVLPAAQAPPSWLESHHQAHLSECPVMVEAACLEQKVTPDEQPQLGLVLWLPAKLMVFAHWEESGAWPRHSLGAWVFRQAQRWEAQYLSSSALRLAIASSKALSFAAAEALRLSSSSSIKGLNFILALATAACTYARRSSSALNASRSRSFGVPPSAGLVRSPPLLPLLEGGGGGNRASSMIGVYSTTGTGLYAGCSYLIGRSARGARGLSAYDGGLPA